MPIRSLDGSTDCSAELFFAHRRIEDAARGLIFRKLLTVERAEEIFAPFNVLCADERGAPESEFFAHLTTIEAALLAIDPGALEGRMRPSQVRD